MKAAAIALVLLSLSVGLGGYPLLDPDEGRNAEVAREMAATGNYLLPRLNGLPYVDKPALSFAAAALSIKAFGATELAARLPSLLFTLATITTVWVFARRVAGPEVAWIAAMATGASPLTLGFARTVIFDSAVAFWTTLSLSCFYLAIEKSGARFLVLGARESTVPASTEHRAPNTDWYATIAWAALGFGVLTKGPVALALPLMVVIPYVAWRRAWRAVLDPVGVLLFLAIVLPWVRYMSDRVPGYLRYVFATETVARLTTPALQRTGPWWYFLPILLAGALPWSVSAMAGARREGNPPRPLVVYLLLWIAVPLLFFSLSQSKRPQYVVPLVVPIALLVAVQWSARSSTFGALALAATGAAIALAYPWIPGMIRNLDPAVAAVIPRTSLLIAGACLVAAVGAWRFRTRPDWSVAALSLPLLVLPFASAPLMRAVGNDRSGRVLASAIEPVLTDGAEVVGVGAYPLSLPFYLGRPLLLSTADGRELTSNYLVQELDAWRDVPGSPLRPADWWREAALGCDRPRFFVIRSGDAEARAFLAVRMAHLVESRKYAVYGPCGNRGLALQTGRRADPSLRSGQALRTGE